MKEGVALFFSQPEASFGHDVHWRYRQDPDLFWLTGFPEPDTVAVLDADRRRLTLFVRPKDRLRETWDGRRAGVEGARRDYGADDAHPIGDLAEKLPGLVRGAKTLWHAFGQSEANDRVVSAILARFRREVRLHPRGPAVVADPTDLVHEMRLVKDVAEMAALERSCAIASRAHREAMAAAKPGAFEYEVEAVVERRFRKEGSWGPAYVPIVASGENATILHYVENRRRIEDGDLVLVDAGCEWGGYASDITRTFPASGRFTKAQRRLYDVVLRAQKDAIATARVGKRLDDVHAAARETMVDGLLDLGLLAGRRATILAKGKDAPFVLHKTSHWLGMDVHDRGRYTTPEGDSRPLEPGMVLTVEPGIYVRPDEKKAKAEYLGLGVRIEDDVLVTEGEPKVLTAAAPKEPEDLLALTSR